MVIGGDYEFYIAIYTCRMVVKSNSFTAIFLMACGSPGYWMVIHDDDAGESDDQAPGHHSFGHMTFTLEVPQVGMGQSWSLL